MVLSDNRLVVESNVVAEPFTVTEISNGRADVAAAAALIGRA